MNCKNCGFALTDANQTCPNCGTVNGIGENPVQNEVVVPTTEPVVQAPQQVVAPVAPVMPTTPVVPNTTPVVSNPVSEPKAKSKTGIILIIIIALLVLGGGCFLAVKFLLPSGGTSGLPIGNIGNSCGKSNPDHFIVKEILGKQVLWGLTDLGKEQESIVIPSGIDKFLGTHFTMGTSVKHVCFESDDDVDLMGAFRDSENLETIILPKNLTTEFSFSNCPKLKEITIPAGVETIQSRAFIMDKSLKKVVFKGDLNEIGLEAFSGCESLEAIELPDSVEKIYDQAFKDCKSLKSITLPKNLKHLNNNNIFENSGIETLIIPKEVELEYWHKPSPIKLPYTTVKMYKGSWVDTHFTEIFSQATKIEYID